MWLVKRKSHFWLVAFLAQKSNVVANRANICLRRKMLDQNVSPRSNMVKHLNAKLREAAKQRNIFFQHDAGQRCALISHLAGI